MTTKQRTAKLITFGNGGHSKEYGGGCRLSGYDRPDNYLVDLAEDEGAVVLDKIPALETDEGFRWVFKGPMVDVDVPEGEVDRCPLPHSMFAEAMGGSSYGTLLAIHEASKQEQKAGALDSVSLSEYVAGWARLGARVGVVVDGRIEWQEQNETMEV